jgi:hypothetical protein
VSWARVELVWAMIGLWNEGDRNFALLTEYLDPAIELDGGCRVKVRCRGSGLVGRGGLSACGRVAVVGGVACVDAAASFRPLRRLSGACGA